MDGRAVLIAALACAVGQVGCYRSHEPGAHPDRLDASIVDAGQSVPACDPSDPGLRCEPETNYATWRERVAVDGRLHDVCFCAPVSCTARYGCTRRAVSGDAVPLACTERVPPGLAGGACIRTCETHDDCPTGMLCLSMDDVRGVPYDRPRACFYAVPVVE